jgi:hypothetical protein
MEPDGNIEKKSTLSTMSILLLLFLDRRCGQQQPQRGQFWCSYRASSLPQLSMLEDEIRTRLLEAELMLPSYVPRYVRSTYIPSRPVEKQAALQARMEAVCNKVRDRYEDKVARTLPQTTRSSRCGRQLCKEHERSNM